MTTKAVNQLPPNFCLSPEVSEALYRHAPVVALESAVITHGLPRPLNFELARDMETTIRQAGAVPATIALLEGKVHIGLSSSELEQLAFAPYPRKISRRDFGAALARHEFGGTTVAGTLIASSLAGIRVFSTGGIGGVHRNAPTDVSADLPELGRNQVIVISAGAKAILDLPATLEYLETTGVPVIGYQTDEFPAFYSPSCGIKLSIRANSALEAAEIARQQWDMGLSGGVLVANPIPQADAIPYPEISAVIDAAIQEADAQGISGAALTPYLLSRVGALSHGKSVTANLALLKNNAQLAAEIAAALSGPAGVHA